MRVLNTVNSNFSSTLLDITGETIDIDSDVPTTNGLITDDEDFGEGSGSGDGEEGEGSGPPDQTADLTCDDWPCENGGTCYLRGETPMCTCALGWEGAMCEDGKSIILCILPVTYKSFQCNT